MRCSLAVVRLGFAAATLALLGGCADQAQDRSAAMPVQRPDASTSVVSLGNLRTGEAPSQLQTNVAAFLFGLEPDAPLSLIKPMDLAAAPDGLLVCEGALQTILRWTPDARILEGLALSDSPVPSGALAVAPNGDRLIAGADGVVRRFSAAGAIVASYKSTLDDHAARIGGIACVQGEVWVTNIAAHRVEVFDAGSGQHLRSIGQRGRGKGEFGLPLGMAVSENEVFVVDMLNDRVQVLDADGRWLRDVGAPGNRAGYFGRPKSVAVGPDGTIFVVDAASQSVHAFDRDGRPLLTFGGLQGGPDALVLPAGVAIWTGPLNAARAAPAGFMPEYHVLVSEQIVRPGIRVYAWRNAPRVAGDRIAAAPRTAARVSNPHWRADQCTACHASDGGRIQPIARASVDRLCISCHDGRNAVAEAHSIGGPAVTKKTLAPPDWVLLNGRLTCITCHEIRRHCATDAVRPAFNPALVRGFDTQDPLKSCKQCHVSESWRVNPHHGTFPGMTSPTASCNFCHIAPPASASAAGSVRFDPRLKAPASKLCQGCHVMHADPAPQGHLDALVADPYRLSMLEREGRSSGEPRRLPLDDGRISCATCHNPHPADAIYSVYYTEAAAQSRSAAAADAGKSLRLENMDLCRYCHPK